MNIEIQVSEYNCPKCNKKSEWNDKVEFDEYNTAEIWDHDIITCECGAEYTIDITCKVEIEIRNTPSV